MPRPSAGDCRRGGEGWKFSSLSEEVTQAVHFTSPAAAGTKVPLGGLWTSQILAVGPQGPTRARRKWGSPGNTQARPGCSLGEKQVYCWALGSQGQQGK